MRHRTSLLLMSFFLIGVFHSTLKAAAQTVSYDKPLKEVVVDLGHSQYRPMNPEMHNKLSCYYYKNYLVKQLDETQKGAEWFGIVPLKGGTMPECSQTKEANEIRINDDSKYVWEGYFIGVIRDYLFLDSADGQDGALAFGIFDLHTGKKLFEDQYEDVFLQSNGKYALHDDRKMRWNSNGELVINYIRVQYGTCFLMKKIAECRDKIESEIQAKQPVINDCSEFQKDDSAYSSVIFYQAESTLKAKPETRPVVGPMRCAAAE
jgi:hypothetical protein